MAAALTTGVLGPPEPIFFDFPPSLNAPPPKAYSAPESLSRHGRRLAAYRRLVDFIRAEKFDEAARFAQRQSSEIRSWPGFAALEAGLSSAERPAESLALYDRILKNSPRDRYWVRALAGYRSLLRHLSQKGDYLARARLVRLLASEWRNEEAKKLLEETLLDVAPPDSVRADLEGFGAVLASRLGDFEKAEAYWANRSDVASLRRFSALRLRQGRFADAADIRLKTADLLKSQARLKELARAFDAMAKGGLTERAEKLLADEPALKKIVPSWSFFLGLSSLIEDKPERATAFFSAEEKRPGAVGARALYFKGRSLELKGRFSEASQAYQIARSKNPGYYQLLAAGRYEILNDEGSVKPRTQEMVKLLEGARDEDSLGFYLWISNVAPWPWPDLGDINVKKAGPGEAARTRGAIAHYLAQGDLAEAVGELAGGYETLAPKKPGAIDDDLKRWILLAAKGGDYRLAIRFMAQVKSPNPGPYRTYLHPLVYGRPILLAYRRHDIPPQIILSVIRVESAFQADAVSSSNARGLTQLLPSTAKSIAEILGEPEPKEEDLFDPALNVRYGAWYLNELYRSFGEWPLALAAYNGGPFNVKSYVMARLGLPLDVFIETLPMPETVRYVQSVLESRFVYEAAYLGTANYPNLTKPVAAPIKEPPPF
jgi:soluble lytic murein transglycosylase